MLYDLRRDPMIRALVEKLQAVVEPFLDRLGRHGKLDEIAEDRISIDVEKSDVHREAALANPYNTGTFKHLVRRLDPFIGSVKMPKKEPKYLPHRATVKS